MYGICAPTAIQQQLPQKQLQESPWNSLRAGHTELQYSYLSLPDLPDHTYKWGKFLPINAGKLTCECCVKKALRWALRHLLFWNIFHVHRRVYMCSYTFVLIEFHACLHSAADNGSNAIASQSSFSCWHAQDKRRAGSFTQQSSMRANRVLMASRLKSAKSGV